MSKLEQLLQELCPDGVEFCALSDVLTIKNGRDYKQFAAGEVPVYGSGGILAHIDRAIYDKVSVLIPRKGSLDKLYYVDTPFWTVDTIFYTEIDQSRVIPKYVYHYLLNQHLERLNKAGGVPSLTQSELYRVQIPVPPLKVQEEIVRVLDDLAAHTAALTAELAEELTARQKQYEYYRDKLLSFDTRGGVESNIIWRPLGEVCSLKAGKAISAQEISSVHTQEFNVPCYGGNGLRGYVREANQQGSNSLIGRQGVLCGNVNYVTGSYYATEHAVVVTDKGYYNSRFLYHILVHKNLNQYKTAGAQPGLSVGKLETILVPIPDREIQDRIAYVLDNFEAVCNDLNIGLSAEIEARQKQYEYYRDALLTFMEKGGTIFTHTHTHTHTHTRKQASKT